MIEGVEPVKYDFDSHGLEILAYKRDIGRL